MTAQIAMPVSIRLAILFLVAMMLVALLAPLIAPYDPIATSWSGSPKSGKSFIWRR